MAPPSAEELLTGFLDFLEWKQVREGIIQRAESGPGRHWGRQLAPTCDPDQVRRRQARTAEALQLLTAEAAPQLDTVADLPRIFERCAAQGRPLATRELGGVAATLEAGARARAAFQASPGLLELVDPEGTDEEAELELAGAIRTRIGPFGIVLDEASELLSEIRHRLGSARERLRLAIWELTREQAFLQALAEFKPVEHEGVWCLKVRPGEIRRVPGPIRHEEPGTGNLLVEAEAAQEHYNRLRHLELDQRREEMRIAGELSERVLEGVDSHLRLAHGLIDCDLHLAMARQARELGWVRPELAEGSVLELEEARHPLLLGDGGCVPIAVSLSAERRLIVISGPNGGGKTVAMKTVGLLAALAHAGSYVPAARAHFPMLAGFLAVAQADSSVGAGLSTFQAHARDLAAAAAASRPGVLVLLDEIGLGTDPSEAAALAQAFLEHVLDQGVLGLATTHLSPLKAFAREHPAVANAAVALDEACRPTFTLHLGRAGKSYALDAARHAGLPESICARAAALHAGRSSDEPAP